LTFLLSACESLFGVFFASFFNGNDLLCPEDGFTLSLVPGLITEGGIMRQFYFSEVESI